MNRLTGIFLPSLLLLLATAMKPVFAQEETPDVLEKPEQEETSDIWEKPDTPPMLVTIADPFIELHTGPGKGYPIFHVIDRGEQVEIVRRKTNWFRIIAEDGKTGWASREQMQQTLLPSGEKFEITELGADDFEQRKLVFGITGGEFENAPIFTIFGAYSLTENLAAELHFGKSVGDVSSATLWKASLVMQPLPDLTYSPYMSLGLGEIDIDPSATLITANSSTNQFSQFGVGIQRYVSRSFLLRFEYNEYIIFSPSDTTDNNEKVSEWKFGFAVFF